MAHSQGYNPRPQLSFALALPVGPECESEWLDLEVHLETPIGTLSDEELLDRLNAVSAPGIAFHSLHWHEKGVRSLVKEVEALEAGIRWVPQTPDPEGLHAALSAGIDRYRSGRPIHFEKTSRKTGKTKQIDITRLLDSLDLHWEGNRPSLSMRIRIQDGQNVRPEQVAQALLPEDSFDPVYLDVRRKHLVLREHDLAAV